MVSEPIVFVGMFIVGFACFKLFCARVVTVCKSPRAVYVGKRKAVGKPVLAVDRRFRVFPVVFP